MTVWPPSIDSARVGKRANPVTMRTDQNWSNTSHSMTPGENPKYQTSRFPLANTMPLCLLCHLFSYINVTPVSYSSVFTHTPTAFIWLLSLCSGRCRSSGLSALSKDISVCKPWWLNEEKSWLPPPTCLWYDNWFWQKLWIKETADWTVISSYPDHLL